MSSGFLWLAASTGLLSLLTPCVFPMVPVTIAYFSGAEHRSDKGLRRVILFGAGIVSTFTLLGLALAAVFAASPMFCQNLSYAWTKLFATFYAILAIAIYFRAWRRGLTPSPGTPGEGGRRPVLSSDCRLQIAEHPLPGPPPLPGGGRK